MGKSETLLQVKDAESKAKQTIEQARSKEKELLSSARKEAVDKIQQAEKDLRSKSASELASQKASLASQKEGLLQKGNDDAAALEAVAVKKIPQAKMMIKQQFERTFDAATGINE
ncbi:hypothetical protein [Candidatus Methanomassiliicoccus intestinalis]|uniref:H(+)-transporting ATP synthase, subunit H n=2 Tax=Candidatus Methanomassiliicoccus intestinalis TaxID=1406512 RepID=R9T3I3_METII|nr:hypothetical protein [Candidatus Methanomassiliicoccus intestinalis]AGN25422.1 H(+)-transporting ATP synthase, subunit H [Candidatus Methanomassiliicoccus intestinalis Issoire-Mx1]TQS81744.1 MAG: hypothetical protein A3206_03910 [Candidatus Methanomassiliicoccus intestinalis]TQS84314.1 MAG: hypothetical protein A3207_05600 [Candidatus Methanomassiliicoccus intestinalis]